MLNRASIFEKKLLIRLSKLLFFVCWRKKMGDRLSFKSAVKVVKKIYPANFDKSTSYLALYLNKIII